MRKPHPALVSLIRQETESLVYMTVRDLYCHTATQDEFYICLDAMFSHEGPLIWNSLLRVMDTDDKTMRARMAAAQARRPQTIEGEAENK